MKTLIELVRDAIFAVIFHLAPRFANVLLFIVIGRLAGPAEAGVFSLATTYLLILTTFTRGLDDLVVRQVSREPDQTPRYLTNFLLVRLALSLLLYAALVVVVLTIFHYSASTTSSILLLGASVMPDSLTLVAQAILLGRRRFAAPAITMSVVSIFKLIGGGLVLAGGGGLQQIAWVWLSGSLLGMAVLLTAAIIEIGGLQWSDWLDYYLVVRHWRSAVSFLFITTVAALESQSDTVLLSAFHGEAEVGWYGAATTIAFSILVLSQAYRFSVYPLMARYALQSPEKLTKLYERSMRYIGALILPVVIGISLLSPQIVAMVFGSRFGPTARVLEILVVALIFIFLNEPGVRMMLVHDRQRWVSLFLVLSTVANLAVNAILVPVWGASGAALARLCSSMILFLTTYYYVNRFIVKLDIIFLLTRPVLATIVMALVVWMTQALIIPVPILLGAITYCGSLWLVGGILPEDAALVLQAIAGRVQSG